jgi:Tfp pilus assembly protein PilV
MRHNHPTKGFAILEALVGLLIVSTALAGAMHLYTVMAYHSEATRQRTQATTMAQQAMEILRTSTSTTAPPDHTDHTNPSTNFSVHTHIQPTSIPSLHQAHITIAWQDRNAKDHQLILNSLINAPQAIYSALLTTALDPHSPGSQLPEP